MRKGASRLERLIALSRAALAWESLWRAVSWALAALALFVAAAWFGLFLYLPGPLRALGPALLAGAIVYGVAREFRWPTRAQSIARLDRDAPGGAAASGLTDDLALGGDDPATRALWRVHRARLEQALARTRVSAPAPRMDKRDARALRFGALLLAVVAAFAAGDERTMRLASAFHWTTASAGPVARLDIWLDPPAYTGRAPIIVAGETLRGEPVREAAAPVGSTLVVRVSPPEALTVTTVGALAPLAPAKGDAKPAPRADGARRYVLQGPARIEIAGRDPIALSTIADAAPKIELLEQPRANARGSLTLVYQLDDDYAVAQAEAVFDAPEIDGRPAEGRPLHDPPRLPLALGAGAGGLGEGRVTGDLSDHPWAGARVRLTLKARDEAGNEGFSAPIHIVLPQRAFAKPLARAIVEQRRLLALEPGRRERALAGLAALMLAPESEDMKAGAYLGLRTAFARLRLARDAEDLRGVVDYLWAIALQIEGGDLSDIERALRAAADALREALQHNASPEEIKKRADDLRAAMDKFLQALAEQQGRQGERTTQAPSQRMISPDQLRDMLNRMESMARDGDMADARRMLDRLQDMLENLRQARPGSDQKSREMNQALRELDNLTREQQQLRDESYRDRDAAQEDETGAPTDRQGRTNQKTQRDRALAERQKSLRDRLDDVRRKLGRHGDKSQNGDKSFGEADEAMREAEGELGKGGGRGKAVDAQGRAVEALRKGAGQLAQQMRRQGQGEGEGEGGEPTPGDPRQADGEGERDPLGRPMGRRNDSRARYDPLGASPALRAQRVLEELRRRLGEPTRPQEELDYLERLIRRY